MRSAYVRQSMAFIQPGGTQNLPNVPESRPADIEKLRDFKPVDHLEHRDLCNQEKYTPGPFCDLQGNDTSSNNIQNNIAVCGTRIRKIFTIFPYRDPIYLVAVVFLVGSVDLVINALFDLLPRTIPSSAFETEETVAVPATVLIGSVFFFVAGIFDTFGALNADHGTFEVDPKNLNITTFKPALLGTPEFQWSHNSKKFLHLTRTNIAFQAGLIVLFGGVIFMFAGIVDFPGVIPEESPIFTLVVDGPQVIHGFLFFVANGMLALSSQKYWWQPKIEDPDWFGAVLNTIGGFNFMLAGLFLAQKDEVAASVTALIGSLAFVVGSFVRLYVAMEIY